MGGGAHDLALQPGELFGKHCLVIETAQIELETAVLRSPDDGNRQRAERSGETCQRPAAVLARPQRKAPTGQQIHGQRAAADLASARFEADGDTGTDGPGNDRQEPLDRKSTRLNSSHVKISYAVFCLKKKKKTKTNSIDTNNKYNHNH